MLAQFNLHYLVTSLVWLKVRQSIELPYSFLGHRRSYYSLIKSWIYLFETDVSALTSCVGVLT